MRHPRLAEVEKIGGGTVKILAATLASLQARTSASVTAGDVAIVTDYGNAIGTCASANGSGSTWQAYERRVHDLAWTDTVNSRRYPAFVTLDGEVGDGSITVPQSSMNIDHDGVVLGLSFISIDTATLNTVTWNVHLDESTTPAESDSLEWDTAGARYDFTFATAFTAASNKRLHVSVESDNNRGQCVAKLHYKVDILSGPFA